MATPLDLAANFNGATVTEAQQKIWIAALRSALAEMGDPMGMFGLIQNLGFSLSVAGNALTIALKTRALADADANNPITAAFRNVTPATGDFSALNVTAASSLVVSSGSTLGTRNGIPFRLWFGAFNDAGTWRPWVMNCLTTVANAGSGSDVTAIYPLAAWGIGSSVAPPSASAQVFYTGTAVSAKPYVVLGYATWETGLATAGTWTAGPTRVQPFGPGVPLPGQVIQAQRNMTGAVANASTSIPFDDTIPQSGEGTQYMSQAITPSSAANALKVSAQAQLANAAVGVEYVTVALFQDATANAIAAAAMITSTAETPLAIPLAHMMLAGASAATTFKIRAGTNSASNMTFNGLASTRKLGGVFASYMQAEEIMA